MRKDRWKENRISWEKIFEAEGNRCSGKPVKNFRGTVCVCVCVWIFNRRCHVNSITFNRIPRMPVWLIGRALIEYKISSGKYRSFFNHWPRAGVDPSYDTRCSASVEFSNKLCQLRPTVNCHSRVPILIERPRPANRGQIYAVNNGTPVKFECRVTRLAIIYFFPRTKFLLFFFFFVRSFPCGSSGLHSRSVIFRVYD